jgi:hypothetical protein
VDGNLLGEDILMAIRRLPIPAALDPTDEDAATAIADHLIAQGITDAKVAVYNPPGVRSALNRRAISGGSGVIFQPDPGPPALVIDSTTDPTAALATYTGAPSTARNKLLQARDIALAYRDKVLANQAVTAAETAKALAAAITLIERLARMD